VSSVLLPMDFTVNLASVVTMIGTPATLVLQSLMARDRGFEFSVLAPVPVMLPIAIVGVFLIAFGAKYLIPIRKSPLDAANNHAGELITELEVVHPSPFIGAELGASLGSIGIPSSLVVKLRRRAAVEVLCAKEDVLASSDPAGAFRMDRLDEIKIEIPAPTSLGFHEIVKPAPSERLCDGDILFLSAAHSVVDKLSRALEFQRRGLRILSAGVASLNEVAGTGNAAGGTGTSVMLELVVSPTNPFIGQQLSQAIGRLATKYSVGVVAVRSRQAGNIAVLDVALAAAAAADEQVAVDMAEGSASSLGGDAFSTQESAQVMSVRSVVAALRGSVFNVDSRDGVRPSVSQPGVEMRDRSGSTAIPRDLRSASAASAPLISTGQQIARLLTWAEPQDADVFKVRSSFSSSGVVNRTRTLPRSSLTSVAGVSRLLSLPSAFRSTEEKSSLVVGHKSSPSSNAKDNQLQESISHRSSAGVAAAVLRPGDVLLVVAPTEKGGSDAESELLSSSDFLVTTKVGSLPAPRTLRSTFPVFLFAIVVALAVADVITYPAASFAAAALLLFGGWAHGEDLENAIEYRLLISVGGGVSFATAVTKCVIYVVY
jgi:di/tricarboxylate transporter